MGLAESVREASNLMPTHHKLAWIVNELGDDGPELLEVLADESCRPAVIHSALLGRGFDVSRQAVQQWCDRARR